jgi:hypothetical protein
MKKKINILFSLIFHFVILSLIAQENKSVLEGNISYVSSQNVYVKFASTSELQKGDTLYIQEGSEFKAALIVEQLSSMSCVTKAIAKEKFVVGDRIIGFGKKAKKLIKEDQETGIALLPETNEVRVSQETSPVVETGKYKQNVYGRIKLSSNSNFSNNFNNDNQRFRYTFNLNANNISNSAISLESYVAFSHRSYDGVAVPISISDLKLYSLAARLDLGKNTRVWLGRRINNKIANVGAVDGLQVETTLNSFTFGAVIGSRPSYTDYSIDFSLFEFGGYISHKIRGNSGMLENTYSVFEQKNAGKTDRRFMYFQQSNSLAKNLFTFVSFEVDMYRLENGLPKNEFSLTSFYASLRYRFSSKFSATASYDARKNVVYYETFQNLADSILESSTRQGYRIRMNFRPLKKVSLGVSASYRYRPEDSRPTKNANAFVRYSQLPYLKASLSVTANLLQTSYMDGKIYGARLNKDLFSGKLNVGLNYRNVNYEFVNSTSPLKQDIAEINLLWNIVNNLSFSASYEGVFESDNQYNRVYLSLRKRF